MSLSRFISMLVAERVQRVRLYSAARERQLRMLDAGLPLGTHGSIPWTREELHER
ncbi:MAG: hypothetical protein ACR2JC_17330 [Chloroflexota bacterium]